MNYIFSLKMSDNELPNKQNLLPPKHIPITNKKCSLNYKDVINDDCELVLFELPKGFDKTKLKTFKIKKFRAEGKEISLTNQYKGECYDKSHPIPNQVLAMVPKGNGEGKLYFKPIDRYIKVVEALDLLMPSEEAIIPRKLRLKKHKMNEIPKSNKRKESINQ